jgi:hypothetical protein
VGGEQGLALGPAAAAAGCQPPRRGTPTHLALLLQLLLQPLGLLLCSLGFLLCSLGLLLLLALALLLGLLSLLLHLF